MNKITDIQSYSFVIRNVFHDAVLRLPFFATGYTPRKTKFFQIQPQQLPYLGVYILDEIMLPDGDANAGAIGFIHTLRIGFSVIMQNNDPILTEAKLDEAWWALMNGLWRDQYVMNMLDTWNPHLQAGNPDNVRVEGVTRGVRKFVWGNPSLTNETPVGELQYDVSVSYRSYFEPIITDDLLHVHIETVPLREDNTVPSPEEVQRVISAVDFLAEGAFSNDAAQLEITTVQPTVETDHG